MPTPEPMTVEELERLVQLQRTDAYRSGRADALALAVDLLRTKGHTDAARLLRSLDQRTPDGRVPVEPPTEQLTVVPGHLPQPRLAIVRPATQETPA